MVIWVNKWLIKQSFKQTFYSSRPLTQLQRMSNNQGFKPFIVIMIDNELPLALPFLGLRAKIVGCPAEAAIYREKSICCQFSSHTGFVAAEATASYSKTALGHVRG